MAKPQKEIQPESIIETHLLKVEKILLRPSWDPYCAPYVSVTFHNNGLIKVGNLRIILPFAEKAGSIAECVGSSVLLLGWLTQFNGEIDPSSGAVSLRVAIKRTGTYEQIVRVGSVDGTRWIEVPEGGGLSKRFSNPLGYPYGMGIKDQG